MIGIAREGDLNCHDHDLDIYYNPSKYYPEEPWDLQSGIMKQVMDELKKVPLRLTTNPKGGSPGASWEDAEYDVGTEACFDKYVNASGNFAMGLSRVRLHMEAWPFDDFISNGVHFKRRHLAGDAALDPAFAKGLQDAEKADSLVWRGFKVPVPSHPFYYLEVIDPKWYQQRTGEEMHGVDAGGHSAKKSLYISCAIKQGGMSQLEMGGVTEPERRALLASLMKNCGPSQNK